MSETLEPLPKNLQGSEIMSHLDDWRHPIIDDTVPSIGHAIMRDIRVTGLQTAEKPLRVHTTYTIELSEHQHGMEITRPVSGDPTFTLLSLPGFTEHGKGGIRKKMHSHLSYTFPEAQIISIDSNGIGTTGDRYDYRNRHDHGLEAMGQQRLDLILALAGNMPVFVQGTSMGTVISHRLAKANIERAPDQKVDLRGLLWLSPALVDPSRIVKDMVIKFPLGIALDLAKELSYKTSPAALVALGRLARKHDFHPADLPAMLHQVVELLAGTPEAEVAAVVSKVPTVVVSGERDSLTQIDMFRDLEAKYPDTLSLELIKGRGHGLAMKPGAATSKLERAARGLVDQTMSQTPNLSIV